MKKAPAALSFGSALSHEPADKRIEILRLVGESGSISQAARDAGVSYKAAWQAIDTLTNLAGGVLVERAVGGAGGGGALLTDAGRQLLALASRLAESRRRVMADAGAQAGRVSSIGLRTSMRNQFPCVVHRLQTSGQMVRVFLQLPGEALLVSRITRASAELLGLEVGQAVLALCKATAVVVEPHLTGNAAGQRLTGRAQRVSRGAAGDEVSLLLDAGLQLVGFAASGSGMRANTPVSALIDESALVIALAA
ncbi:MAG: TOBE domain-containing protein [Pseudomonadota bacterium]|nr:TOBE domain-containing protein [Pseudomonadota bacterium]